MIPANVYFSIINFVLFVGLMVFVLRKPAAAYLQARRAAFEAMLKDAQQARIDAEKKLANYETRMAHVEMEMAALKRLAQEDGERDRVEIVAQAKSYAAKMANDTERMIAQELRRSKELLKGTTIDLAIVIAERMLREQMTPAEHARLMKNYIQQLDGLN